MQFFEESNQDNFIAKKVKDAFKMLLKMLNFYLTENDNDYGNNNYSNNSNKENINYNDINTNISNNNKKIDDDNERIDNNSNNNTNIEPKQTSSQDSNLILYVVIYIIDDKIKLFNSETKLQHL
ncbi:hypothetical protein F8M41_007514 [Gigaspora margarita]|uniref:Uncharacterized protein n=1 Tax=Gigaspora margarita TaxID=4874 RepID=A0A8H4AW49_GIGMA|nr:hypothetical protein F8M41_007514 [Gigaspora margarita]